VTPRRSDQPGGSAPSALVEVIGLLLWFLLFTLLHSAVATDVALDVVGSIVLLAASVVAASMWGRLAERWRPRSR